jgi:hypothetical protein
MTSIGFEWRIAGRELAGGGCGDESSESGVSDCVDTISDSLTAALRRHYGSEDPEVLAGILMRSWGPLRHTMLTDGASATIKSGGTWRGSNGPITVRLWAL